jgi:GH24 family phage-related lysozyme (muramidase)
MRPHRIDESEKKRILTLHETATKKGYLMEQKKDGSVMKASQVFWDNIKNFEGNPKKRVGGIKEPMLKAYKDSQGIWTIGYGHTEGVIKGMKISNDIALKFLYDDAAESADCVRRIFKEWKSKGLNYEITQGQFDALVSLVFNAGCNAVRTSDFIQSVKKGDMKRAAEQIKSFRTAGGVDRRNKESEIFLS